MVVGRRRAWLSLRGSYGTSYRAPALFEQFLGSTIGFPGSTTDICDKLSPSRIPRRQSYAACQAQGLPLGFPQNNGVTVISRGGADAGLKAETSKNLTFGACIPAHLGRFGNFSLAVDYYRIKVNNGVSQLGTGTLLRPAATPVHIPNIAVHLTYAVHRPGHGRADSHHSLHQRREVPGEGHRLRCCATITVSLGGTLDIGVEAVRSLAQHRARLIPTRVRPTSTVRSALRSGRARATSDTLTVRGTSAGASITSATPTTRFLTCRSAFSPAKYDFRVQGLLAAHSIDPLGERNRTA